MPKRIMVKRKLVHRFLASVLSGMLVLSMAFPAAASEPVPGPEVVSESADPESTPETQETNPPETQVLESQETETKETEAQETETQAPEAQTPEIQIPELQETETKETEAQETETQAPEAQAPETQVPETQAPEAQVPETQIPEPQAPETQEAETQETEVQVPETQETESQAETEETETTESQTPDVSMETETPETQPDSEDVTESEPVSEQETDIEEPESDVVTETDVEETIEATVQEWGLSGKEELWEVFDNMYRVYPESITSNGFLIENSGPENAIDDRLDTWWIPDIYKTEGDRIYLDVAFTKQEMIRSIVFNAGLSGDAVYEIPFSIYSSLSEDGDDFVKAGDGTFSTAYTWMETVIEEQPFKRLRFSFPLQTQFIPVCCSIRFYSETADEQVIAGLPTTDETVTPEETAVALEDETPAEEAEVSTWPLYRQDEEMVAAYDKLYRVYPEGAPTTNLGTYYWSNIQYANDNRHDTFWETGKTNTDTEKAWLDFTFRKPVSISRIVYGCRLEGYPKGFATEFEIYASMTDEGDDFEKVAHGTYAAPTQDMIQIDFKERKFKRLRFKYIHSNQEYPSCREMFFYKKDTTETDMDELFKDYRMYEINEKYNTLDKLHAFQAQMIENPKYELSYKELFERAEKILNGELVYNPDLEVFSKKIDGRKSIQQNGDVAGYAHNTLKFSTAVTNRQVVGISALSGDKITVYVDGKKGDKLPSIVFSQAYGYWSSWLKDTTQLHLGVNEITVPEFKVANANYSTKDIPSGGPIYVINPYTGEQQSPEVKLYFENCDTYPYFMSGGDVAAYKKALSAQADRARENPTKYFDVTELVSNHVIHTVTATLADEMYDTLDPQANLNGWDEIIRAMLAFDGIQFDPDGDHYNPMNEHLNQNFRVSQNWDGGFMFTASEHIGLYAGGNGEDKLIYCLNSSGRPSLDWGFVHEYGHAIELGERAVVETTNNMPANLINTYYNKEIRNENYFDIAHSLASDRDKTHGYENGAFNSNRYNYIIYFILESYYNGYWGDTDNLYRYSSAGNLTGVEKQVYLSSLATGIDLGYYFERWGYSIKEGDKTFTVDGASDEYKSLMGQARSEKKISTEQIPFWYIDSAEYVWMREHGGLESAMGERLYHNTEKPVIEKVVKTSGGRSIRIKGDHDKDEAHLGYEILEGDGTAGHEKQVIGFTYSASYTDSNTYPDGYEPEYTVIAYDRLLQKSAESAPESAESAVDGVCEYNNTVYPSIGKALEAAEAGGTIYLLKDIYDCGIEVTKSVTLTPKDSDITLGRVGAGPLFTVKGSGVTLSISGTDEHSLTLDGLGIKASSSMLCSKESAMLNLSHVTVMESVSSDNGGAVTCLVPAKSTMDTVIFENNRSGKGGGALYNTGSTTITNCTFTGNTAATEGGAIDNNSGGVITLTGCTLNGNSATTGGAFYGNGHTTMTDTEITGNAADRGGAIGFASANGARTLTVKGGTSLSGNTADDGTAVYLHSNAIAEFQDVVWKQDAAATAESHDIVIDSGKLSMDGGHINVPLSLYKNNGSITIQNHMPEKGLLSLDLAQYTTSEPLVTTTFDTVQEDTEKITLSGDYGIVEGEDNRSLYLASDNTVTLHTNGGTINAGDVTGYITGTYVVLPTDVTLEGMTFGGWYDNAGLKGTSVRSIKQTDTGDKEYWAKWNITRYKISYNTNGGSIREVYTSFYYATDTFELPQKVEKANPADKETVGKYAFEGWYDNKELEGDPITEIKEGTARNVTVYAKWSHLAKPEVHENQEPASCTTGSSYEVVSYCVDCGEEMSRERIYEDDALGHTFGEWIETSAPDCDDDGVRSHSCEVCGYTETDGISATGHDWEEEATIDRQATCTTDGSSSIHCRKCNATKDSTVIPMLEHTPGRHEHENEVSATCTTDGGYDDVVRCTVCGTQLSSTYIPTEAYGHNWGPWETVENATCHSEGAMKRVCLECGFPQMKETSVASHEWESQPRVDVEPTCTTEGSKSIHCRNCDAEKEAEVIPATGHKGGTPVYENEIPATCTTDGSYMEAIYCEVCHQLVSKEEKAVPAPGHSFGEWQTLDMPDCDDAGTQIRHCSVCGVSETKGLSAEGHDWDAVYTVDKEPTCSDAGSKSIHCRKCGAVEYAQEIPALGHTPGTPVHENEIAPGCDAQGSYNEAVYCDVCHTAISRQTVFTEPAGHQFGDWKDIVSPDCNDSGARERSCKVCGLTETDNVDPQGHDWLEGFIIDREPTCTEEGSESIHCRNCDAVKDAVVLHAKGHTAGGAEEENRTEASCTEDGSYDSIIRCTECGELIFHDKAVLEAKGHQYMNGVCTVCGEKQPGTEKQTEPGKNTESEKQLGPEKSPEPKKQTETEKNMGSEKQSEPEQITEPGKQSEPEQITEPGKQSEPEQITEPEKQSEPEQNMESEKQSEPEQITEPGKQSEPEQITEPGKQTESEQITESEKRPEKDRQTETDKQPETDADKQLETAEPETGRKTGHYTAPSGEGQAILSEEPGQASESETQTVAMDETEAAAQTEDNTPVMQMYLLMLVSLGMLTVLFSYRKKS